MSFSLQETVLSGDSTGSASATLATAAYSSEIEFLLDGFKLSTTDLRIA